MVGSKVARWTWRYGADKRYVWDDRMHYIDNTLSLEIRGAGMCVKTHRGARRKKIEAWHVETLIPKSPVEIHDSGVV